MSAAWTGIVRREKPQDADAIWRVLTAAFGGTAEASLVDRLRADGDLVLSLVAEEPEEIVGHIAFPRLTLETSGRVVPVCGLAPLAVLPDWRRQGIGSALVRAGLALLRDRGEGLVFVLGEVGYYRRFGFTGAAAFASPYSGPHFHVLPLTGNAPARGEVRYPPAFDALSA